MNIRFRTLIALALLAVAGIGGVVKPTLSIERAPSSALQFNAAPAAPELQFADFYDRTPSRLNPDLQFADFYDAAEPDLQFALQFENKPGRLNPDLQFS